MDQFDGILETNVGYANGNTKNPKYEDVKAQKTGHSETVEVHYDENIISLQDILTHFYVVIDPTSLNKQGEDVGESYRCGIYYVDEKDLPTIYEITKLEQQKYEKAFVIEIKPLQNFYKAEEYHQKYLEKNPQGYCHINTCFFK